MLLPMVHSAVFPHKGKDPGDQDWHMKDDLPEVERWLAALEPGPWQPSRQRCHRMGLDCLQETVMTLLALFYEESGTRLLSHAWARRGCKGI